LKVSPCIDASIASEAAESNQAGVFDNQPSRFSAGRLFEYLRLAQPPLQPFNPHLNACYWDHWRNFYRQDQLVGLGPNAGGRIVELGTIVPIICGISTVDG